MNLQRVVHDLASCITRIDARRPQAANARQTAELVAWTSPQPLAGEEMATLLGLCPSQVKVWRQHGLLRGHAYTAKPDWLYEHSGGHPPRKAQGVKLSQRRLALAVLPEQAREAQCEA